MSWAFLYPMQSSLVRLRHSLDIRLPQKGWKFKFKRLRQTEDQSITEIKTLGPRHWYIQLLFARIIIAAWLSRNTPQSTLSLKRSLPLASVFTFFCNFKGVNYFLSFAATTRQLHRFKKNCGFYCQLLIIRLHWLLSKQRNVGWHFPKRSVL